MKQTTRLTRVIGAAASLMLASLTLTACGGFPAVDGGQGDPTALMGGIDGMSCSANTDPDLCKDFLNLLMS